MLLLLLLLLWHGYWVHYPTLLLPVIHPLVLGTSILLLLLLYYYSDLIIPHTLRGLACDSVLAVWYSSPE